MERKIISKVVFLVLILSLILSAFTPIFSSVQATSVGQTKGLYSKGTVPHHLKSKSTGNAFVTTTLQMFKDGEKELPAYCLNVELNGVEKGKYNVTVEKLLQDDEMYNKVWRVVTNGYPYKNLGFANWKYAYQATKMAVYCVTGQADVDDFYGDDSAGQKVADAIKKLAKIGNDKSYGNYYSPKAEVKKQGEIVEENIGGIDYYSQNYTVDCNHTDYDYTIVVEKLPEGTKIFNSSNSEQKQFEGDTTFKVSIPKSALKENTVITGTISTESTVTTYPLFYSESQKPGYQPVVCPSAEPVEILETSTTIKLETTPVEIKKLERGAKEVTALPGAVFEIYKDVNENEVYDKDIDTLVRTSEPTNEQGITTLEGLEPGKYLAVESKAPEGYNLDSENKAFEVKVNSDIVKIDTDDSVITSTVEVTKISTDDNEITGDKAGTPLKGAKFNIYDRNRHLLYENLETDENGKLDVVLRYGDYIVEEVRPPEFYLLNENAEINSQIVEVREQGQLIPLTFEDESVKVGLVIEKEGIIQCQANDEIIYNFPTLRNDSNVPLDDFTWTDVLPTEYIRATKLYTGTYNEDLNYEFYYKTNKSGDEFIKYNNEKTEDGTFNTLTNNYIDLAKLNTDEEYVVEWKVEFGTVKAGFEAVEKPFMFAKVNDTVKADDKWTNHTFLTGNYTSIDGTKIPLGSKDDWTTTSYAYSLSISKLPKTGF